MVIDPRWLVGSRGWVKVPGDEVKERTMGPAQWAVLAVAAVMGGVFLYVAGESIVHAARRARASRKASEEFLKGMEQLRHRRVGTEGSVIDTRTGRKPGHE